MILRTFQGKKFQLGEEMEGEEKKQKTKNKELKPFHLQRGEGSGYEQWPQMPAEKGATAWGRHPQLRDVHRKEVQDQGSVASLPGLLCAPVTSGMQGTGHMPLTLCN